MNKGWHQNEIPYPYPVHFHQNSITLIHSANSKGKQDDKYAPMYSMCSIVPDTQMQSYNMKSSKLLQHKN